MGSEVAGWYAERTGIQLSRLSAAQTKHFLKGVCTITTRALIDQSPSIKLCSKMTHLEEVVVCHVRSQAGEGLSAGPSDTHQQAMAPGLLDDSSDARHVLNGKSGNRHTNQAISTILLCHREMQRCIISSKLCSNWILMICYPQRVISVNQQVTTCPITSKEAACNAHNDNPAGRDSWCDE